MAFVSRMKMFGVATGGLKNCFSSSSIQMSKKIEEVVVIGGGLMGAGIAQVRFLSNLGLMTLTPV